MTKSELVAKMQDAGAWLPGKTVKIDFGGDEGVILLDGANSWSARMTAPPTRRSRSAGTTGRRWRPGSSTA